MKIVINDLQDKIVLTQEQLDKINEVLEKSAESYEISPNSEISLVFVDDNFIKKLNHEYRNKNTATDVLSFTMKRDDDEPEIKGGPDDDELLLGDIVVSLETAKRQAEEYNHDLLREVTFLTIHGMLHILGYDHETEEERTQMREEEEYLLSICNITR
ncbi:rRNA maturation RNase YbeY [Selenomonadales bacterium OttesenSCG-928-I06]|nr:rRNA maturation RNase YbeY [Selenomonadales bacterium OttesenSCG-928-I06]